jgi:hypothetical protein
MGILPRKVDALFLQRLAILDDVLAIGFTARPAVKSPAVNDVDELSTMVISSRLPLPRHGLIS